MSINTTPSDSKIKEGVKTLKRGDVIVHATETCYGFACDALNKEALKKLYALKQMSGAKPISLLVPDLKMAKKYGFFNSQALKLAKKYWPGPLTIIVKRKKLLPAFLNPRAKTVGFRVPGHALSRALARMVGRPITTTSANISGKPSVYSIAALKKQFNTSKRKPDYILDSGRIKKNLPSTVIDVTGRKIKILRQGELYLDSGS